jgi:hypothetical protein
MTLEMLNYLIELALNNTSNSPDIKEALMVINSHQVMNCQLLLHRFHNKESGDTLSKMKYRLALLSAAQQDVKKAEQLLSANTPTEEEAWPVMDFTHWPAVRYAGSGEVQTPESEAYFQRISAAAATIRSAITDAERAKGTSSFHILEKILALNSALPERYKAMANIQY